MTKMTKEALDVWENREDAIILTTVSSKGIPNSIYATCVKLFDESTVLIADNYFDKTKSNLLSNEKASVLFISKKGKSIQLKGKVEYKTEGMYYGNMKSWNPEKHPGKGVAVFEIQEIYSGAKKLV